MTTDRFRSILALAACLAIVGAVGWRAGAGSTEAPAAPAPPTTIAIVNVEKALNGLDELAGLNKKLEERVNVRQTDLDNLRTQLEDLQAQLDQAPTNALERRRELRAQIYELRETATARTSVYQSLINIEKGEIIRPLYFKLGEAVTEIAGKQGYDLVLFDDRGIAVPPGTERDVNVAIQQKRILFAHEKLDITDQVVLLMNSKFKAGAE